MQTTTDIPRALDVIDPALDAFFIKYQKSFDINLSLQKRPSGLIIYELSHPDLGNLGTLTLQTWGEQMTRLESSDRWPSPEETLLFEEWVVLCLNNLDNNESFVHLIKLGFPQQQAIQIVLKNWRNSPSYAEYATAAQLQNLPIRARALRVFKGLEVDSLKSDVAKAYALSNGREFDEVDEETEIVREAESALTTACNNLFIQRERLTAAIITGFVDYLYAQGIGDAEESEQSSRLVLSVPSKPLRRGGPSDTPEGTKRKYVQDWFKVKGTMTQDAYCAHKGFGTSTLRKWIRQLEAKGDEP